MEKIVFPYGSSFCLTHLVVCLQLFEKITIENMDKAFGIVKSVWS